MNPLYRKILAFLCLLTLVCSTASAKILTLDDCIELALKNNQDIIHARGNARIANGNVWQAFGAFLPSLDASANVTETHTHRDSGYLIGYDPINDTLAVFPYESGGISKSYSMGASAGLSIFNGGRNIFNYFGAKADKKYYDYSLKATEDYIIYRVKVIYLAYLKMLEKKKISKEAVKRGEEQFKLADSKFTVGSASKSDVLKAKVQYGNDKLGLIAAENAVKVAHADLAYLIGIDVGSDVQFSTEFKIRKYDGTELDAMKFGMANHPGLLAYENNLTAAKYDVKSSFGRYLPSLSVNVSRTWTNSKWSEVKKFKSEDGYWMVSTTLSIPIFQNFSRKRDMSRAKATLNNARADYYYTKNKVAHDIREGYLDINRANEALNVAGENVKAAQEDMTLVQERYNLGAATMLELLDAQVSLITAQNSKIEAEFDYNLAVAKLENAMGIR
jgi:TolC family type I secretion outer membrane protein